MTMTQHLRFHSRLTFLLSPGSLTLVFSRLFCSLFIFTFSHILAFVSALGFFNAPIKHVIIIIIIIIIVVITVVIIIIIIIIIII